MTSLNINHKAIILLVFIHQAFGAFWYSMLEGQWLTAAGLTMDDIDPNDPSPYIIAIICTIALNYTIALLLALRGVKDPALGAKWAALLWAGILLPHTITHYTFAGSVPSLLLIDMGHSLVAMLISGTVLGFWQPKKA